MKNLIFNEGYQKQKTYFDKGINDYVFCKKKKLIDLSNCAGSLILGHNSLVYKRILKKYLYLNASNFAHPNIYAEKFSKTIKKIFPNFDKIIFCNSGTESIIKSLRISRSLNKKKYVVSVLGSWHGSTGELLFGQNKKFKNIPLSAGLSDNDKKNLIIIPYGDIEKSKKILDKKKKNINCLIIEPIQASLPTTEMWEYLNFLKYYCKKNKIVLIFDEMITGLRSYKYSVQNYLNIKPDITTIGKIFGGGLPIGIIGISTEIKNKLNKNKQKVFFGGTFSGNSIATFVGNETVKFILKNKKKINLLNQKSKFFQESLNSYIKANNLDLKVYRYASILRIVFTKNKILNRSQRDFFESKYSKKIKKFKNFLFSKNIYYSSSGIIFFSFATSKKNIEYVIKSIKIGFNKFLK